MRIDPRLAERRREVAEDRARRKVNRLVKFLIAIGVLGGVVWLFLSPLLSVAMVTTSGIAASSAETVLVEHGVVAGTPLILIRAGNVETALETDPWIGESLVEVDWPTGVVVRIEESRSGGSRRRGMGLCGGWCPVGHRPRPRFIDALDPIGAGPHRRDRILPGRPRIARIRRRSAR